MRRERKIWREQPLFPIKEVWISIKGVSYSHRRSPVFPSKGCHRGHYSIPSTASEDPQESTEESLRLEQISRDFGGWKPSVRLTAYKRWEDEAQTSVCRDPNERLSKPNRAFVERQSCVCQKSCVRLWFYLLQSWFFYFSRRANLASCEVLAERISLSASNLAEGTSFQPSHLRCLKIWRRGAETQRVLKFMML